MRTRLSRVRRYDLARETLVVGGQKPGPCRGFFSNGGSVMISWLFVYSEPCIAWDRDGGRGHSFSLLV